MKLPQLPKPTFKGWRLKIITSGIMFALMFTAFYFVSAFYDTYKVSFQTPIILQPPVVITQRQYTLISPVASVSAEPTPAPIEQSFVPQVEKAQAKEPSVSEYMSLAKFIHYRESSYGKYDAGHHIYCRNRGMWNEIGYNPQNRFCFNTALEGFAKLENWLKENVPAHGVAGALCRYNSGKASEDCQYYQDYLAWKVK